MGTLLSAGILIFTRIRLSANKDEVDESAGWKAFLVEERNRDSKFRCSGFILE